MPIMIRFQANRFRCLALGAVFVGSTLQAQQQRLVPGEIGEIVEVVLKEILPPEARLTSFTVLERGVRFDYERTLRAFGYPDLAETRSGLLLKSAVNPGSRDLLGDCSQSGLLPCKALGRATYVTLEPFSISKSEAVVWLHVSYASQVDKYTFLNGFSVQVHLARSDSGNWRYVKVGERLVG